MKLPHSQLHFILTRPRSGSTLLVNQLNKNPYILSTFEEPFLLYFHKKYKKKTKWSDQEIYEYVETLFKLQKLDFELFFEKKDVFKAILSKEKSNLPFERLIELTYLHFLPQKDKTNISRIIDKQFWYCYHWQYILKHFPDTKFIILIRNVKDHITSMKNRKMGGNKSIYSLAYKWRTAYDNLTPLIKRHPNKILIIKYEEFVQQSKDTIKNIEHFLNVQSSHCSNANDLKSFFKKLPSNKKQEYNKHKNLLYPINTKHINISNDYLSDKEKQLINYICHKTLYFYQYHVTNEKISILKKIQLIPDYIKIKWIDYLKIKLYLYLPLKLKLLLRK